MFCVRCFHMGICHLEPSLYDSKTAIFLDDPNRVAVGVALAVPAQCLHRGSSVGGLGHARPKRIALANRAAFEKSAFFMGAVAPVPVHRRLRPMFESSPSKPV